jgi:endonuclease/exonuclease/phosphatase family metal-dependent hydrolase
MELQIATYNIHKGVSSLLALPRIHALKKAIHELSADLIFLQEVQGRHDRHAAHYGNPDQGRSHWPEQSQHEFLAGEHHHSAYGMNAVYDHGHHGNALLSKLPIISTTNRNVSAHNFEHRGILHCILHNESTPVHCYVVHFGLFAKGRSHQAAALIDMVSQTAPPDAPIIIAGDFNDWRSHLGAVLREGLSVIEVFDERRRGLRLGQAWRRKAPSEPPPARTFPAFMPWLRLDRIYVRGFQVKSAQVLHGPQWAKLSDHAPIIATLQLNKAFTKD